MLIQTLMFTPMNLSPSIDSLNIASALQALKTVLSSTPAPVALGATVPLCVGVPAGMYRYYDDKNPETWGEEQELSSRIKYSKNAAYTGLALVLMQIISTAGVANLVLNILMIFPAVLYLYFILKAIR
jgi:hypothetical protein